ncbi:MAG: tol-pal system-associated acyl-CoA thioesterase [Alphaproteobacteria bacterium]|nr:tol-pal system-associated acyl-CoA thioesterase [Alphaproteobacteria bacterium]
MIHKLPIRVYYEDTDAGGVVYHANHLKFGERGRTEFLRATGFENSKLNKDLGLIFVVRHIEIDYLKTAHLDDRLSMETSISELKNTSFTMHQALFHVDTYGNLLEQVSDMKVTLVCVDTQSYKPLRIPEKVKEAFQNFTE